LLYHEKMNKYHIMSSLFHVLPPMPNQPVSPSAVIRLASPKSSALGFFLCIGQLHSTHLL